MSSLPPTEALGHDARRARILAIYAITTAGWSMMVVQYVVQGLWISVGIHMATILGTILAGLWTWRIPQPSRLGAHLCIAISAVGLFSQCLNSGGGYSVALWFMSCAPLMAAWMLGVGAAARWTVAVLAMMAGVAALAPLELVTPELVPSPEEHLLAAAVLAGCIFGFGAASQRNAEHHLAEVTRQGEQLRLQSEKLAVARDAALAGARAKQAFVATVSHELRTPLHATITSAELLRAGALSAEQAPLVDAVATASQVLARLVDDILEVSRLEADGVMLDPHPEDLRTLVASVASMVRPLAEEKGLSLQLDVDAAAGVALVDGARLRQVLINLAGNAVKFTHEGSVTLGLHRDGDQVRLSVLDTGIGIAPDALERIFEPFVQAESGTTRRFGGSGLGLAISKGLIERMGGRIVANSDGSGSCFTITLLAPALAGVPQQANTPLGVPAPELRVLVVDDEALARRATLRLLRHLGMEAAHACNGAEAVARIARERFDVVLMDLHMPGMDGVAATAAVRASDCTQPWVIGLTATSVPEERQALEQAGADDVVGKPFGVEALRAALERAEAREVVSG